MSRHIFFSTSFIFYTCIVYAHRHTSIYLVGYAAVLRMTYAYIIYIRDINKTPCRAAGQKSHRWHTLILYILAKVLNSHTNIYFLLHVFFRGSQIFHTKGCIHAICVRNYSHVKTRRRRIGILYTSHYYVLYFSVNMFCCSVFVWYIVCVLVSSRMEDMSNKR